MAIDLRNFPEVNFAISFKVMNVKELCYVCIKYVLCFMCTHTHTHRVYMFALIVSLSEMRRMSLFSPYVVSSLADRH